MTSNDHEHGGRPEPVWRDAPRHRPEIPLPGSAYVPGGDRGVRANIMGLVREASCGADDDFYLYGIDLYHQGYLWEAHEAWEWLWRPLARGSVMAEFYRGLILNAAAQLKIREGRRGGVHRLSGNAFNRIQTVLSESPTGVYRRMDVARLAKEMVLHYGALWEANGGADVAGSAPRLVFIGDAGIDFGC